MKGIIESTFYHPTLNCISHVFIVGDDGNTYFGHRTQFIKKAKHYRKGRVVTFAAEDNGHARPDAVNIDVELPDPVRKSDELLSIEHLRDGAYIKRVRKPSGQEVSMIIKDGTLVISCLPEFERDMVWMYQRGPSGRAE